MKVLLLGVQLTSLVNFRGPLIRDLIAAGHEVVAIAPEPAEPWLSQLNAMGARYIEAPIARTGLNPLKDAASLLWLWRKLRAEKPDVVFAFQAKAVIYGIPAAWLAGIKRRVAMIEGLGQGFIRGEWNFKRRIVQAVVPLLYRISLIFAQKVIFLNDDDVADFSHHGIIRHQQVVRIPGIGVDLKHYAVKPLPQGPLSFLMIGRLITDKGIREYLSAAKQVRQKYPEAQFVLIGGIDTSHVGIPVEEIQTNGHVNYLGEKPDVRPYLEACHVFVLPSYREGMPRSTMEAMATGRAIITTDVSGARETVVDQITGHLVKPRNPDELAAAMVVLLETSPQKLFEMGQASRKLAEERYEVSRINRIIIAALCERE